MVLNPELSVHVDEEGERELFGTDVDEPQDNELEWAAEDLDTDQILALAAEEEERCLVLENEVEEMKHHQQEEEDLLRKQQEWEEAIHRLHAVRSKWATLKSLLLVSPPTASSL